jgi:hypothetical protein
MAPMHEGRHNVVALTPLSSLTSGTGPRIDVGPLRLGESRDVVPSRTGPFLGGTLRLRCECRAGDEQWAVLVQTDLPHLPPPEHGRR